ncbi:MAG TPA: NADH dehydrogenase (quinone) subunit D, partial [Actinomycetota bacterium]|nr:NADH dehydrogenase (quinone) subunit D [Actinomycetota bacterium]
MGTGVTTQRLRDDLLVVNMGPQHPSTHGVLRLLLTLDGETIVDCQPIVGYLHTGIEKNAEYRTWQQGSTFVTRMDYLSPFFNELGYCLSVERLLGIEAPARAEAIRVLLCEMTRISSHLVWLATTSLELGAISMMLYGFRERELILDIFEMITGLRMNHAYFRVGGLLMDLPEGTEEKIRAFLRHMPGRIDEYETLLSENPIWVERNKGVGYLSAETCLAYGVTGPLLRAAGVAHDIRKSEPYCGYEQYEFAVPTSSEADCYARYEIRIAEMRESLRICEQVLDSLPGGRVMIDDPKLAWPAHLSVGPDGIGNSEEYVRHIMEESMEALINHFKIVTQGIQVPAGEVYTAVESPRGELGYYVVSDGGVRPYRVRVRDPSFVNLPVLPEMVRGRLIADTIACVASVDPV